MSEGSTKPLDGHSRTGQDAQISDRTRSGPSIASTLQASRSTYELFKDTPVEQSSTQSCKVTSQFHVCGPNYLCHIESLLITGQPWMEKESAVKKKGRQVCFFTCGHIPSTAVTLALPQVALKRAHARHTLQKTSHTVAEPCVGAEMAHEPVVMTTEEMENNTAECLLTSPDVTKRTRERSDLECRRGQG